MITKTAFITGATGGIGKATAIALAKQNFKVIIHGRDEEKTKAACEEIKRLSGNTNIFFLVADLFLLESVRNLAKEFKQKYNTLDILINNAGGIMNTKREVTNEGHEKTMAVNLFAPFLLTELLLNLLIASPEARIINVSSNSHQLNAKPDFKDLQLLNNYNPLHAYGNAKLFLIWMSQHLAARLKQDKINHVTVNTMHPGAVATNFGRNSNLGTLLNFVAKLLRPLLKTVEQGADTLIYLALSAEVKTISGNYFVNRKPKEVAKKYYSHEREETVLQYCKKICNLPA